MNKDIEKYFDDLCSRAKTTWENTFGTDVLEPDLLPILNFVKEHPVYRDELTKKFINIVNDYNAGPLEIVIFCMRELQWKEVKEAALLRQNLQEDPRIKSAMEDVLDVYNPVWDNSDLYQYYSKQE